MNECICSNSGAGSLRNAGGDDDIEKCHTD